MNHSKHLPLSAFIAGMIFLVGSGIHIGLILTNPNLYDGFADAGILPFVAPSWQTVVMANPRLWIGLLAGFELVTGILLLRGGLSTRIGIIGAAGFTGCLMVFGWWFWAWALPFLALLAWTWLRLPAAAPQSSVQVPRGDTN